MTLRNTTPITIAAKRFAEIVEQLRGDNDLHAATEYAVNAWNMR
jgi:hypothetical protein